MPEKWDVKIRRVNNGWLVNHGGEDTAIPDIDDVFMNNKKHCECLQDLLYFIKECLGEYGSKHDDYRLFIEVKRQGVG